mgnify:CR=1 FL=1
MAKHIQILNGPNLNMLGTREPETYGTMTLEAIAGKCRIMCTAHGFALEWMQSNSEAVLIDTIQAASNKFDWMIVNGAGLTHTSIALRDALLGVSIPFIEIHISNVFAREDFRKKSYLSDIAVGVISGHGIFGYELALMSAYNILKHRK